VLRVEDGGIINGGLTDGDGNGGTTELRVGQLMVSSGAHSPAQIFNGSGGSSSTES